MSIFTGIDGSRTLDLDERVCPACELPHCGSGPVCGLCREQGKTARALVQTVPALEPTAVNVPTLGASRLAPGWEAMQARFTSRCPACQAEIRKGDSIGYQRAQREARHDRCAPRVSAPVAPAAQRDPRPTDATPSNLMDLVAPSIEVPRAIRTAREIPISSVPYRQPRTANQATRQTGISPVARTSASWAVVGEGESIGCVILWAPLEGRSTTVGKISDAWRAAELPESWLLDGASEIAALGKAVSTAGNRGGLIARSVEGFRGTWQIEAPVSGAQVGGSSRTLALRVTLVAGGKLAFDPEEHSLRATIERDYQTARDGAVSTSEVRCWLDRLVYKHLLGSGFGAHRGAYFVPGAAEKTFRRIHDAIKTALGGHDPLTALPVGPSADVKTRVIESLADDARTAITEAEGKLGEAHPKDGLPTTTARAQIDKLKSAEARLAGYEALIGVQPDLRAKIEALASQLGLHARDARGRRYHSDAEARFSGIWDELSVEESRD